ncbi:hypothetical protein GLOTRDRAFT_134823 [Gloeophyllum trabeum ATCC 11539]|uniref:C2H2-type domain-containing protein n=1 Tax=Gloeophyllum trabeum (strain ATCC 11539 / FP-39264 / Madison 617) TaxID=670483 RepID=S7S2R1_GLOTA|nr:uncharacterized protein GLOTRDRAFT_134823 [Gloeophyllum trabeum ATCC 11539]EPQ60064.1 hypothetical protein GLOTRDRAFT_134823 [Gloeophyllum trabeum ATCC 11539]
MVRAHVKQSPEEKKEAHKKKVAAKKKSPSESGVWPCKINGCNKQFAREADLKRHQRTTKLHSMPGFRCPQCDATFTRTDALRRHQKSRHNGVIVEADAEMKNGEGSSASKSRSRSGTPATDGKGKPEASGSGSNTQATPPGPTSYYRPHTLHAGYAAAPSGSGDYPSTIGLPTSATRGSWPAAPAWTPEGGPPQMGSYQSYYQPSPYYRTSAGGQPNGDNPPPPVEGSQSPGTGAPSTADNTDAAPPGPNDAPPAPTSAVVDPQLSQHSENVSMKDVDGKPSSDAPSSITAPVIDPALEASSSASASQPVPADGSEAKPVSMQMTAAAMQAVIDAIAAKPAGDPTNAPPPQQPAGDAEPKMAEAPAVAEASEQPAPPSGQVAEQPSTDPDAQGHDTEADADGEADIDLPLDEPQGQEPVRPPPMEPMLTEDGEPMLNPGEHFNLEVFADVERSAHAIIAELLTQESLASPPPS